MSEEYFRGVEESKEGSVENTLAFLTSLEAALKTITPELVTGVEREARKFNYIDPILNRVIGFEFPVGYLEVRTQVYQPKYDQTAPEEAIPRPFGEVSVTVFGFYSGHELDKKIEKALKDQGFEKRLC